MVNSKRLTNTPNVDYIADLLRKENTMPKDCEGFRIQMERPNEFFPDRELLSVTDVVKFFNFRNNFISKVEVARTLS